MEENSTKPFSSWILLSEMFRGISLDNWTSWFYWRMRSRSSNQQQEGQKYQEKGRGDWDGEIRGYDSKRTTFHFLAKTRKKSADQIWILVVRFCTLSSIASFWKKFCFLYKQHRIHVCKENKKERTKCDYFVDSHSFLFVYWSADWSDFLKTRLKESTPVRSDLHWINGEFFVFRSKMLLRIVVWGMYPFYGMPNLLWIDNDQTMDEYDESDSTTESRRLSFKNVTTSDIPKPDGRISSFEDLIA